MAYNPYFPNNYQPFMPQFVQPPTQPQQPQGIIWVQGKNAAQSFALNPGQSAILMDSDAPYVYKKETAPDGRPLPMETYKLVKEDEIQESTVHKDELNNYVRKEQIEEIVTEKIEDIVKDEVERRLSEFSFKPTRTRTKSVTEE